MALLHLREFTENREDKADRKKQFSKGYYKVKSEIKNYINQELKKVVSQDIKTVVLEDLKDLKKDKRGKWSKAINRKFGFWLYSHVLTRISQLCEVAGVQCHKVDSWVRTPFAHM